jgi:hypothetical protein
VLDSDAKFKPDVNEEEGMSRALSIILAICFVITPRATLAQSQAITGVIEGTVSTKPADACPARRSRSSMSAPTSRAS